MNCKSTFAKIFAAFLFASVVFGFTFSGTDSAVVSREIESNRTSCFRHHESLAPSRIFDASDVQRSESELMARLFQLMFILFIISPPIIAVMLFLIWKELKKRNELK